MDSELETLEQKIRQAAQLCQKLRDENRDLRQKLAALQGDKKQLSEKIDGARTRLETIQKQLIERSSHEIQGGRDRFRSD